MKIMKVAAVAAVVALALAACCHAAVVSKDEPTDPATATVKMVGDTAQTAAEGTGATVEMTVTDTGEAPMTALGTVMDTAGVAFEGADKAIKTITGEE